MFLHTGLQNYVKIEEIQAICSNIYSAPTRRLVRAAEQDNRLIDHTEGRKTRSVLILKTGDIVLTTMEPRTLVKRMNNVGNVDNELDATDEDEAAESDPAPVEEVAAPAPAAEPAEAPAPTTKRTRRAAQQRDTQAPAPQQSQLTDLPE